MTRSLSSSTWTPWAVLALIVIGLVWYTRQQAAKALEQGAQAASTAANAPLQAFRDPDADSSTVGTQAWFVNQINQLKRAVGLGQTDANPVYETDSWDQHYEVINSPVDPDVPYVIYN